MHRKSRLPGLFLAAIIAVPSLHAQDAGEDIRRGREIWDRKGCGSCHGLTLKGGLGPALLPATLKDKDAEGLTQIVLHGVPGTPMPPWAPELSEGEARWLVGLLKEGVR